MWVCHKVYLVGVKYCWIVYRLITHTHTMTTTEQYINKYNIKQINTFAHFPQRRGLGDYQICTGLYHLCALTPSDRKLIYWSHSRAINTDGANYLKQRLNFVLLNNAFNSVSRTIHQSINISNHRWCNHATWLMFY